MWRRSMGYIDIIMPAYNSALTLKNTVESIQVSGLKDFSIIIINDGSYDQTENVCKVLCDEYSNVSCINQNNAGVSRARNHGLERATGEYVWFFDADDSVLPDSLKIVQEKLNTYKPDMLILGMCFDYYHNQKVYRAENHVYPGEGLYTKREVDDKLMEIYQYNTLTSSCNKVIRREMLMKNKIFYREDMFLMEDFLFSLDCLEHCERVYMLSKALYHYHQSEDEGNVYRRIKKIGSLSEYVKPFRERLLKHPDIFSSMYFMMLRQKLWKADRKEIKMIAEDHIRSGYVAYRSEDIELNIELRDREYTKIRCRNLMLQVRHIAANIIKRTFIYQKLRGI